ncbi:hypothetical protein BDZ45DRAFT_752124 [Acephala macrosclerotiorum]|nr:hypothetical protein BDZ45DRAFT_752124 [Acephala macrosclerotiorum]
MRLVYAKLFRLLLRGSFPKGFSRPAVEIFWIVIQGTNHDLTYKSFGDIAYLLLHAGGSELPISKEIDKKDFRLLLSPPRTSPSLTAESGTFHLEYKVKGAWGPITRLKVYIQGCNSPDDLDQYAYQMRSMALGTEGYQMHVFEAPLEKTIPDSLELEYLSFASPQGNDRPPPPFKVDSLLLE